MKELYVVYTVDCFCEANIFGLYEDKEMAIKDSVSFSDEMTDVKIELIKVIKKDELSQSCIKSLSLLVDGISKGIK